MRKILAIIAIVVVLIIAILAIAATKPDTFRVERTASIKAPPEKISWTRWSARTSKRVLPTSRASLRNEKSSHVSIPLPLVRRVSKEA